MSRQITFLPSGKTCPIEANETLLDACLRAGLTPVYGCSNGNCGDCKAVLKSGELEQVRHYDYAFSGPEKAQGSFLMCTQRALSDIVVEADVTQSAEDIPVQDIKTKVKAVEHLDPQVIKLHLQTPRSQRLRFIAGQSVTLSIGEEIEAQIAIASCPCDDRNLHFHVPDVPGDAFSEHVFSGQLKPRDAVQLKGPNPGKFYLDDKDKKPFVVFCWHTGFAPIASLMEHAMSLEIESDIHLYRFSPTPDQQYLSNLTRSWSDAFDNITSEIVPHRLSLLSTTEECEDVFAGIAAQYPDLSQFNAYVAGPPNFVEAAGNVLTAAGLSADQIRTHTDWVGVID